MKKSMIPVMAIVALSLLFIYAPGHHRAWADNLAAFQSDDSLALIRAKIEANGYDFTVSNNPVFSLPPQDRAHLASRRPTDPTLLRKDFSDPGPLLEHLNQFLPEAFDWRQRDGKSYIGPVRNQGDCGACYAFGAAAAAEGTYNWAMGLYDDDAVDFSEAFVAFCLDDHYPDHFSGCDGADYDYMELEALVTQGIATEAQYPYADGEEDCALDVYPGLTRFESWHRIACQDIDAIKAAILTYGVVDAAVDVTSAFFAYESGVYEDRNTSCEADPCYNAPTNHLIALVGWDDAPPEGGGGCWILRNSWGPEWGEDGYMRIRYTSGAVSCAASYLVYAAAGPSVQTGSATGVNATAATVNGSVNPNGLQTQYSFDYGPTREYGWSTAPFTAEAGSANLAVSAAVTDLTPRTTYFFRLTASNTEGVDIGVDNSFTTSGEAIAPGAVTGAAEVDLATVALHGDVNPHGLATAYHFEYGTDAQYGQRTDPQEAGAGTATVAVSAFLEGLQWDTRYHYRMVAENSVDSAHGLDRVFETGPAPRLPLVETGSPRAVASTALAVAGSIDANNPGKEIPTRYYIEYGLTTAYGDSTPERELEAGAPAADILETLEDLQPNSVYHYRLVAVNAAGTTIGEDRVATTAQTVFYEDFDHGAYPPDDWTQENTNGSTDWVFSNGNVDDPDGFSALLCGVADGDATMLVTPALDLSAAVAPTISVGAYLGDDEVCAGELNVYYKTEASGDWQSLDDQMTLFPAGAVPVLNLPDPSATYYIALEGISRCSDCISLSDVTLSARSWGEGLPLVTTTSAADATSISASVEGQILLQGDAPVTQRGFCWSDTALPTIEDSTLPVAGQDDVFSGQITGLSPNTRYHVRAYATNARGTAYGKDLELLTRELAAPVALDADAVYANQFTAQWEAVEGASGYYVDLWTAPGPLDSRAGDSVSARRSEGVDLVATDRTITASFHFDEERMSFVGAGNYLHVDLQDGVFPEQAPGSPRLPARYVTILLPEGTTVQDIRVSGEERLVRTDALVYPVQMASSPSLPAPDEFFPDAAIYAGLSPYPATLASLAGVHSMGADALAAVRLNPVRYIPAKRELYVASDIHVTLTLAPEREERIPASSLLRRAVNAWVVNPREVSDRKPLTSVGTVDYLIVTSRHLAESFGALADHRTDASGLVCDVVVIEDIEADYAGRDIQEKIRQCIREYVRRQGTVFVVLGGDDTVVPARICPIEYAYHVEEAPTDLYYAGLDGDWDADGDGVYGEIDDGADLGPDVFVGRIPVRSEAGAAAYIAKLAAHENAPPAWSGSKLLLTGTELRHTFYDDDRPADSLDDGHLQFRDPGHVAVSDSEMWTRRMYRDNIRPYWEPRTLGLLFDTLTSWDASDAGDYDLTPGGVKTVFDRGWDHILFSGHGNTTVWALENQVGFWRDDALTIDTVNTFVYTTACLSNGFDSDLDPSLSEAFIRNPHGGSLTYTGCSRYGWGDRDNPPANDDSKGGASDHYASRYYKRALEPEFISAGEAFALHKADLAPLSLATGVYRWLQFGINFMGDPAIMHGAAYVPGYYRIHVGDGTGFTFTGLTSGTRYSYQVSADDGLHPAAFSNAVNVTTAVMGIGLSPDSVAENLAAQSPVGTLTTADPVSALHTFALVPGVGGDDNGRFTIDGDILRTAVAFDYETRDEYSIRVRTNDGSGVFETILTVTIDNLPEADIALAKTVDDPMPPVGGKVVYTLTAANLGPDGAMGIVIADPLPAGLSYAHDTSQGAYDPVTGLWRLDTLAVDTTKSISIAATVSKPGIITNTAEVSSTESLEVNPDNDRAQSAIDTDTDGDGLNDILESSTCTSPNDRDSDDDGLADGEEDANRNGVLDPAETDPCLPDTDDDGLWDGTESGRTPNDLGPDTDPDLFRPDLDPGTFTDPLNPDSDNDGWMDGEEDANGNGRIDAEESDPLGAATPEKTPPVLVQTLPHDRAGIVDDRRIADSTCFAVFLEDADGIDTTDPQSVVFTIRDGVNPVYERDLGDTDSVGVVPIAQEPDTRVTRLWAVYNRSGEGTYDPVYPHGAEVTVTVDAKDMRQDYMGTAIFDFRVETQLQQQDAAAAQPATQALEHADHALEGVYDAGLTATGDGIAGARIVYDSSGPVAPYFGPSEEVPPLDRVGAEASGVSLNLQPPAVFATPVKVFVPVSKGRAPGSLSVYLYDGIQWVLACDRAGNVTPEGEGWMVPGSRVDHPETDPPSIEIRVYHFTGVQATGGATLRSVTASGSGGCFIRTLMNDH